MGTAADSHISGADTLTESDSHVTKAQVDAIGDKPTCGEATVMPPTCEVSKIFALLHFSARMAI